MKEEIEKITNYKDISKKINSITKSVNLDKYGIYVDLFYGKSKRRLCIFTIELDNNILLLKLLKEYEICTKKIPLCSSDNYKGDFYKLLIKKEMAMKLLLSNVSNINLNNIFDDNIEISFTFTLINNYYGEIFYTFKIDELLEFLKNNSFENSVNHEKILKILEKIINDNADTIDILNRRAEAIEENKKECNKRINDIKDVLSDTDKLLLELKE